MTTAAVTGVDKPGVYDMDIDTYHSQKACAGPSVSNSMLRQISNECPAKLWATSDLNPKRFPPKDTKALSFGRAAHCLVLGEPEFDAKFVISPFDNFTTKEARVWRDNQTRQIVKVADMEVVHAMAAAQRASKDVSQAFVDGLPERTLIWKDEETGIWLKARPDWLPTKPDKRLTTEYKTAETIKPAKLNTAVFDYGYEMQAALVLDGIAATMNVLPLGIAHIVQEKEPPYLVEARLFTPEQIDFGRAEYRRALRLFAHCLQTNSWPGYTTEPTYFETPFWVSRKMERWNDDDASRAGDGTGQGYTAADYLGAG